MSAPTHVAGFLLNETRSNVWLIRKRRPSWQAGKLNAIGGKIELDESPEQAMRREFWEEARLNVPTWDPLLVLHSEPYHVAFFRAIVPGTVFRQALPGTDELLEMHTVEHIASGEALAIPNLTWLVPLAAYAHDRYQPFEVTESAPRQVA
jgi:8-oxo-dGTP diphosphatase